MFNEENGFVDSAFTCNIHNMLLFVCTYLLRGSEQVNQHTYKNKTNKQALPPLPSREVWAPPSAPSKEFPFFYTWSYWIPSLCQIKN